MNFNLQRRLAKEVLRVGKYKIWIDASHADEIKEAITKADVRSLIKKGFIKFRRTNMRSRVRARKLHEQRVKGRQKGIGKRRGTKTARAGTKEVWISKVRSQRELLKSMKNSELLEKKEWKRLYRMVKGGFFRSKAHLKLYIEKEGLVKNVTGEKK